MIVKVDKKEYDVKDCTYKNRRKLHKLNALVWWGGEMDVEKYYDLLEQVQDISGLTESDFKGLEMSQIDQVLQSVFVNYLGLEKKELGG
jgi:hypothetical protein